MENKKLIQARESANEKWAPSVIPRGLPRGTFIDWEKQVAVELRNKEIVRMCLDLFETFKTHARRVKYKDMVQKYLGTVSWRW